MCEPKLTCWFRLRQPDPKPGETLAKPQMSAVLSRSAGEMHRNSNSSRLYEKIIVESFKICQDILVDNYKRMRIFSKWPKMCLIADTCVPCHKFADVKVSYVLSHSVGERAWSRFADIVGPNRSCKHPACCNLLGGVKLGRRFCRKSTNCSF